MDKVQKIREWVKARLNENNSKQSIPQFYGMMEEDARFLDFLDTMQEEPKQCMYSKDNYTEEDRKVLCEGCEEKCEFNQVKESAILQHKEETCKENGNSLTQEPVSNVWHDMSEDAENGRNIIIIYPKDFYGAVLRKGGSQLRNHNKERYVKWAYIDDIINITNKEEPVSEELEEAAIEICSKVLEGETVVIDGYEYVVLSDAEECFKAGAKWQKGHLWKPADGDDLPEIDREVIAILDNGKVGFAHRPTEFWDGKNIVTGKVTRYYPKTYDKGGWNIPDVKWWLDCSLPNMED